MQIGIDSFAAAFDDAGLAASPAVRLGELLERIERADQVGLDVFGIGEHHRREFLDSAPPVILAAAATRTRHIRLTSAVAVLSAADPVRLFQQFATLDLISQGRAEMVVGRGSSIEAFPLFGFDLQDYDALFAEKLDLLLKVRGNEHVTWSGEFRPALTGQGIYPRPVQDPLPIWLGVGGTPGSFARAGALGLPQLKVGVHALGYVAPTLQEAVDEFAPGYLEGMTKAGKERGWGPVTRAHFDAERGPHGAMLLGGPDEVIDKIRHYDEVLGGISRLTFQMDLAALPHTKLLQAIETIGTFVAPAVRVQTAAAA
jgi:alkanesulfonate monooxygenase SsuD/methylene tetrahydromethanopterin reductase-like flavin-dependent oxidoreductase (luciferase family)